MHHGSGFYSLAKSEERREMNPKPSIAVPEHSALLSLSSKEKREEAKRIMHPREDLHYTHCGKEKTNREHLLDELSSSPASYTNSP